MSNHSGMMATSRPPLLSRLQAERSLQLYEEPNLVERQYRLQATDFADMPPNGRTVRASLVLEDQYARTINWLGEIERRLPLARLANCRLTGGNNNTQVHAEISLEVPLADLNYATPEAAKAAADKAKAAKKKA